MLRLQSDSDYRERRRELVALEELVDDAVALIGKARRHGALRPPLAASFEGFAEALARDLAHHLDAELTLRREALGLWEEIQARAPVADGAGRGDAGALSAAIVGGPASTAPAAPTTFDNNTRWEDLP